MEKDLKELYQTISGHDWGRGWRNGGLLDLSSSVSLEFSKQVLQSILSVKEHVQC
jgi:hypothetical protein